MEISRKKISILKQICKLIPRNLVPKLAKKHGVDKQSRKITPWSHVISLMVSQLTHAIGMNDVCDSLKNHSWIIKDIRNAVAPSRNGLSNANRTRNPEMAKELFWEVFDHLKTMSPKFGVGHGYCGIPYRFKRTVNAVDSTTIQLFMNCMDWAKHRRRKAAVKMHLRLDLQTFLPQYVIVKSANSHDSSEAKELCSDLKDGEIVVFDKAYVDFFHLRELDKRGVFWVTRAKDNMLYKVMGQHKKPKGNIIRDVKISLTGIGTKNHYPKALRLVEATVEVDKKIKQMTFITNNFDWAASSVCELYKNRWGVELFFKQIKQNLQISDFLGYNENAVKWQLWIALLVYILLRFIGHVNSWRFSFSRLFTVLRSVLWNLYDLVSVLESCGTAGVPVRIRGAPEQGYLPGFAPM